MNTSNSRISQTIDLLPAKNFKFCTSSSITGSANFQNPRSRFELSNRSNCIRAKFQITDPNFRITQIIVPKLSIRSPVYSIATSLSSSWQNFPNDVSKYQPIPFPRIILRVFPENRRTVTKNFTLEIIATGKIASTFRSTRSLGLFAAYRFPRYDNLSLSISLVNAATVNLAETESTLFRSLVSKRCQSGAKAVRESRRLDL